VDTAKGVLMDAASFFRAMRRDGGIGAPLIYALIGIVVGSVGSMLTQFLTPWGMFGMAADVSTGFMASLVFVPIIAVLALFIGSGLLHVLLLLVAGTKQSYETSFRVLAYTYGSTAPLGIIPVFGSLIGAIWALIVLILGTAEAHEVSQGQAAIAVLLPAVICCGLGLLFGGAVLALIFGAAAAGAMS
jgi:hypothetical protein